MMGKNLRKNAHISHSNDVEWLEKTLKILDLFLMYIVLPKLNMIQVHIKTLKLKIHLSSCAYQRLGPAFVTGCN